MTRTLLSRLAVPLAAFLAALLAQSDLARAVPVVAPYRAGVFGGVHAAGGNVLILLLPDGTVHAFADYVPLGEECAPDTVDVLETTEFRADGSFSDTVANGGIGGQQLPADQDGPTRFVGTLTAFLPGSEFECLNSGIGYTAEMSPVVWGDIDCGWLALLDLFSESAVRSGESSPSGGDPPRPSDEVGPEDALVILRTFVDAEGNPVPAGCPPVGDDLGDGRKMGDMDCNDVIEPKDALNILRATPPNNLPVQAPPECPRFGIFYNPGV
jgi:hypothetical protein